LAASAEGRNRNGREVKKMIHGDGVIVIGAVLVGISLLMLGRDFTSGSLEMTTLLLIVSSIVVVFIGWEIREAFRELEGMIRSRGV